MTLLQALHYFLSEALVSLRRSWKVSLLAVLTIAVSLFVGGLFLAAGSHLAALVESWRRQARVVVYLEEPLGEGVREELAARLRHPPWVEAVTAISPEEAGARFWEAFPGLAGMLQEVEGSVPLPASLEVELRAGASSSEEVSAWLAALRASPGVAMVDDDRELLARLATVAAFVRGAGLLLGGVLLVGATFTIASVVRLTAHLYRQEIEVMRLVGATEFFIRGPFYCEGLLQGLLGGLLALLGLLALETGLGGGRGPAVLELLTGASFVSPGTGVLLTGLGSLAGLVGAVLSVRREAVFGGPYRVGARAR